jgi:hypothetical protein
MSFQPTPAMVAKRVLFDAGFELAGVRLQLFAERLLVAADASPDASCDELVRRTRATSSCEPH